MNVEVFTASFGPLVHVISKVNLRMQRKSNGKLATGCYPGEYKNVLGKFVMIKRGDCTFAEKAHYAEIAGAIGIIVGNTQDRMFLMTNLPDDLGDYVKIPVMIMSLSNALKVSKIVISEERIRIKPMGIHKRDTPNISIYGKMLSNLKIIERVEHVTTKRYNWRGLSVLDQGSGLHCLYRCVLDRKKCCS